MIGLKSQILKALNEDLRFDGRKSKDWRAVEIEFGISKNAEGSARVKFGGTEVLAGVKLSIGKPYEDRPDEGSLMVDAELTPMSNPDFEAGPPDIKAVELARVVDRGIRESKTIDVKKLCIEKGEKAWMVSIDVVTINDEGNLLDAAGLAALAALKDTKFPKLEGDIINYKERTKTVLPLSKEPIPVTVIKIGDKLIVDPSTDEEKVIDARLTVTSTEKGLVCSLQKGGEGTITVDEFSKMIDLGIEKAKELRANFGKAKGAK
ncbi:exosome complex protein Rrp42 [Candidatus Woesearchaeota archaeon]|nr:exosome complex protein Rrp42 [Candidatus Woesearchaeota archaeon]